EARSRLPERVQVLTILRQGRVRPLEQEQVITDASVLILAGTAEDLAGYDATFQIPQARESRVLILGGGRVGRAAARALTESDVPCTIVEQIPGRAYDDDAHVVEGDAADIEVLHAAGLDEAQAALVTTHDDDLNIFLTLYCRRLFPDLQVVSRATVERNVATLYRAGADAVLSYAAIGATALWNDAGFPHRMVIAEGHELFEVPATGALAGSSVRDERVFQRTGCRIVAILRPDGAPAPISEQ